LLTPRMEQSAAEALAAKLAGGQWTHDYALTAQQARALGLPVKVGMPPEVMRLMSLYPQPIQRSGVEYLPINVPRQRGKKSVSVIARKNPALSRITLV
jgi:hypothetical protein